MRSLAFNTLFISMLLVFLVPDCSAQLAELTVEQTEAAAANYQKYCSLCHGEDRQGHVNDHAPSLRSKSLMSVGLTERIMAIAYGRLGTPMASFFDEVGGPLDRMELYHLVVWLQQQTGIDPVDLPLDAVQGDVETGHKVYEQNCAECHGAEGEGGIGTALGNPVMLSLTSDLVIRHAIVNGREDTEMPAFGEQLSATEIDAVTAFIRSRATGWAVEKPVLRSPPAVEDYILNPASAAPEFDLKDGLYVSSADLDAALQANKRMVLLDTRTTSQWQMAHIEGSVPIPYYYDRREAVFDDLPKDGTWIVTYCECPRAAAESVNRKLVANGFENTAVLWEGIQGWVSLGYPVSRGETTLVDRHSVQQLAE
jgi:mono/diheme cytochrome c family protein/rhodanese-related sulfurtransferase